MAWRSRGGWSIGKSFLVTLPVGVLFSLMTDPARLELSPFETAAAAENTDAPQFTSSQRCPQADMAACRFLRRMNAHDLEAPSGARVYRVTWRGPVLGPTREGSIVLTIAPDGRRTLKTPWRRGTYRLRPNELTQFERSLARSDFSALPVYNQYVEMCTDGVATTLEAIVDGIYRLVYFDYCGGVGSESVASALDQLFVFAASQSGLAFPFNPARPTFRGQ